MSLNLFRYLRARWPGAGGYREVLAISIPLIISTSAWSIQSFVDRMFLTWYGQDDVAAALPAGMLNFALMSFFVGTATYVSTFVAQYYGAERPERIGPAVWQGIYVSIVGGLVLFLVVPFAPAIFRLVGHSAAVQQREVVYFEILTLWSMPAIAASALAGFFSGRGQTWTVMWVTAASTAVNLVGDYALIFGHWGFPEWGIRGAAIATAASGVFGFLAYAVLFAARRNRQFYVFRGWRPERELLGRLIYFGSPTGVQFFLDSAGFTIFILILGRLGTMELAASTIAFNVNTLAFMPMIGVGTGVSVLVGQHLGGNRPDDASRSVYSGFHLTLLYMGSIAIAFFLFPHFFLAPFARNAAETDIDAVLALSALLLRFVALYSFFDAMNVIFSQALRGAGDTRFVTLMIGAVSLGVLVLPTWIALSLLHMGIYAAWTICTAYVIILGFTFLARFLQGKWKTMRVIEEAAPGLPSRASVAPTTSGGG